MLRFHIAFDVSNDLRDGILRRKRQQHVVMVGHEMPLFDPGLLSVATCPSVTLLVLGEALTMGGVPKPSARLREQRTVLPSTALISPGMASRIDLAEPDKSYVTNPQNILNIGRRPAYGMAEVMFDVRRSMLWTPQK
jgi:hypothetical protein